MQSRWALGRVRWALQGLLSSQVVSAQASPEVLRELATALMEKLHPHSGEMAPPVTTCEPNTKIVKGIVTSCEDGYGWIENCVFFSTGVVIGHLSVQIGDKVLAFVEEDPLSHDLKATEVCVFLEDDKFTEPYSKIQVLSACVSYVKKDIIHVADEYYFYLDSISKAILGFTPYEGDWLDIEYSVEQGSSKIIVQSLKATKHRHLEEARVTSIHRRQGLLNHSIFFTLNSLKCPVGYTPLVGHVVNAVIVQSIRSHYSWRAIAMSPVKVL
ncbi:Cancer/testis antigen 55 [Microtus ochrogaster]|uniref:Cancer/testis antigen 55 n=1 Tax=Microtus ochrogaster TaxID=79684 RepID=A0A8J6GE33_MICOH|nr:Cancer/testis antigen 55 [Microtus ochrogaster]